MIATTVRDAISAARCSELRARFAAAGYQPYARLDRGRYAVLADPDASDVLGPAIGIASELTGRTLVLERARVLRLGAGDYLLAHHDPLLAHDPVEITLDLSPVAVPGAEIHYRRRGAVIFVHPTTPGALAVVERGPTVGCNHTYVSLRHADAEIVRLVALLTG